MAASAAFGMRPLRPNYAGPLLRVRRSSDNAETDIGSIGTGPDTAALLAFVGAGSGYVTTWYDQIGAGHATQATAGLQPRVVNAGALEAINGRLAMNFMGTAYLGHTLTLAQPLSTAMVGKLNAKASGKHFLDGLNASPRILVSGDANWKYFAGTVQNGSVVSDLNPHAIVNLFNGASSQMFVDGASVLAVNAGAQGMGAQVIGGGAGGLPVGAIDGLMAELVVFPSSLSAANRQRVERSQAAAYGLAL